jgi:hypothetical protein
MHSSCLSCILHFLPSLSSLILSTYYLVKSTNYEASHCEMFSILVLVSPAYAQILSLALCFGTPIFHTRTGKIKVLCILIMFWNRRRKQKIMNWMVAKHLQSLNCSSLLCERCRTYISISMALSQFETLTFYGHESYFEHKEVRAHILPD